MAIQKVGTPEKIQSKIVATEEFEKNWDKLKKNAQPVRCKKCGTLLAKGMDNMITLKKADLSAIIHTVNSGGGTVEVSCSRCSTVNQLIF